MGLSHVSSRTICFAVGGLGLWLGTQGCGAGMVIDPGGTGGTGADTSTCGDSTCDLAEDCNTCPADCGGGCPGPVVPDFTGCTPSENGYVCSWQVDVGGSDWLEYQVAYGQDTYWGYWLSGQCPILPVGVILTPDCGGPTCGDGACEGFETCTSCEADCGNCPPGFCRDGNCGASESCGSCDADCGSCPTAARFLPEYRTECARRIETEGKTCADGDIRCAGPGQEYSDIQTAIDASVPGDAVCIRAGVYRLSNRPGLQIAVNGTAQARIYIEPYPSEHVALIGDGSEAAWNDSTQQKPTAGFEQNGIEVWGDYVTIRGLELSYFGDHGVEIAGDHVTAEGLHVHNNWHAGITLSGLGIVDGGDIQAATIRYNWLHNMRHGSGITISPANDRVTYINDVRVEFNLSYRHGYEPDGDKVPAIPGDPAGGGNSDAGGTSKACNFGDNNAAAGSGNMCARNAFRFNIGWEAADDCWDFTVDDYSLWGNIGWKCGPEGQRGYKQLRFGKGPATIVGNFMHGAGGMQAVGFEPRQDAGQLRFVNNGAVHHSSWGFSLNISGISTQGSAISNNLGAHNSGDRLGTSGVTPTHNHLAGDPGLTSCGAGLSISTAQLASMPDGRQRWQYMYGQFSDACRPAVGSPLIDAGTWIDGIHCSTADDDPNNPHDPTDGSCWHWRGEAPDIGPFEH